MATEIDPKKTKRAASFELWTKAPMPMVTFFKTLDVTNIKKISRKYKLKFNMVMCWCIGKAASQMEEFYMLPVGDKLMKYEKIAVNTVVLTKYGTIKTCDIPFTSDISKFNKRYLYLTKKVYCSNKDYNLDDNYMIIGTSAITESYIDGAVNIYAGFYNNPFLIWGRYKNGLFKTILPVSFQFHHSQLDGIEGAVFLEKLQKEIKYLKL